MQELFSSPSVKWNKIKLNSYSFTNVNRASQILNKHSSVSLIFISAANYKYIFKWDRLKLCTFCSRVFAYQPTLQYTPNRFICKKLIQLQHNLFIKLFFPSGNTNSIYPSEIVAFIRLIHFPFDVHVYEIIVH